VLHNCSTETIAKVVREYEGVRRKHAIGDMVKALKIDAPHVLASFGEDAAVIEHHGEALLLAADGIWSRLMEADPSRLVHRNAYNISAMSFDPEQLAASIRKVMPAFALSYDVDPVRQGIAESWPNSLDCTAAKEEWGFAPEYGLDGMTEDMLKRVKK